ncbi:MAG TPA: lasso peptide biosynthesis B2 protein, partial [Gemmatimonadaceae bacterium]|nr:lasso peptide biosynthesis B2 protein [Gemmatimonadaceae bacterium]
LQSAMRLLRTAPHVWRAWRAVRAHADPRAMLAAVEPAAPSPRRVPAELAVADVRRCVALLRRLRPALAEYETACLLQSLALYRVLRRQGEAVRFVSGVRRDGASLRGHAWVERKGHPFPTGEELDMMRDYRELFSGPPGTPSRSPRAPARS